ncbi:major capsid family protein [Chroococcidiopsis sp.]|uniref:major capsid family protein n=1 Tax=Chroococcidiopsis sp. TaxID=3088168 RepID=UPI003F3A782C
MTTMYNMLTQVLERTLEVRYPTLYFENGELVPTMTDLQPGIRELLYDRITELGDADITNDAATNIPVVEIGTEEDRYPVFMVASGFPVSFQQERAWSRARANGDINRYQRLVGAARKAIAQRINRFTALGISTLPSFPGFLTNPLVPLDNSSFNPYTADYQATLDFLVGLLESQTDNFVSEEPTEILLPLNIYKKWMTLMNGLGSMSLRQQVDDLYPELVTWKIQELSAAQIDAAGITRPSTGKDRIMIYPKSPDIVHRHIEQKVAEMVPEQYLRVDGLRKIYTLFSCVTPAIFDYPQDCRYIDIMVKP